MNTRHASRIRHGIRLAKYDIRTLELLEKSELGRGFLDTYVRLSSAPKHPLSKKAYERYMNAQADAIRRLKEDITSGKEVCDG